MTCSNNNQRFAYQLLVLSVSLLTWAVSVHAATYNIYFNNSEQGANSTSKPTVIVNDPNQPQAKPDGNPNGNKEELPAKENERAPDATAPVKTEDAPLKKSGETLARYDEDKLHFRIMAGGAYNTIHSEDPRGIFDSDPNSNLPFWEQTKTGVSSGVAPQLEASWFFLPNFGATAIVGNLIGVEASVLPIGVDRFSTFQPELSIGIMTVPSSVSIASGPAVGAKLAVNFTESVAMIAGVRSTLLRNPDFNFIQGSVGLAFNF